MGFKAKYVQKGECIDYTPEADVAAGDVVFIGPVAGIAKLDIKANELGALAITGVYEFAKATGAITAGASLYWDGENGEATATPNAYYLGIAVASAGSSATTVCVLINIGASGNAEESTSA